MKIDSQNIAEVGLNPLSVLKSISGKLKSPTIIRGTESEEREDM
jgi:hypothetical protein